MSRKRRLLEPQLGFPYTYWFRLLGDYRKDMALETADAVVTGAGINGAATAYNFNRFAANELIV